jgi:hypothetical protein
MNLASGFQVRLDYSKDVHVDGSVIGLENDFDLTPSLAKFLMANKTAVDQGIQQFSKALDAYRSQLREEMELKEEVMGYNFLTALYDNPMEFDEVLEKSGTCGKHVYEVLKDERESLTVALERLRDVSRDDVCTWWYLFWVRSFLHAWSNWSLTAETGTGRFLPTKPRRDLSSRYPPSRFRSIIPFIGCV